MTLYSEKDCEARVTFRWTAIMAVVFYSSVSYLCQLTCMRVCESKVQDQLIVVHTYYLFVKIKVCIPDKVYMCGNDCRCSMRQSAQLLASSSCLTSTSCGAWSATRCGWPSWPWSVAWAPPPRSYFWQPVRVFTVTLMIRYAEANFAILVCLCLLLLNVRRFGHDTVLFLRIRMIWGHHNKSIAGVFFSYLRKDWCINI